MNLTEFMKETDEIINKLPKQKLIDFIHLRARILKESKRDEFLKQLLSVVNGKNNTDGHDLFLKNELVKAHKKLLKIQNGEIWINGFYNEMYDDWYDDPENEFVYEDLFGINDILKDCCQILHMAIDAEMFSEALKLAKEMMNLNIEIRGDYEVLGDSDLLNIASPGYNHTIIDIDTEKLGYDVLYVAYVTSAPSKRPNVIYDILLFFQYDELKIERLFQRGTEDLPETGEFLESWINFLAEKNDIMAQKLIKEAVSLLNDSEQMLKIARVCCNKHPGLFEEILSNENSFDEERLMEIGNEAIKSISKSLIIRSRIALMTAKYALHRHNTDTAEYCWLEAYRSDTTPINFLRIAVNSRNYQVYRTELDKILAQLKKRGYRDDRYRNIKNELCENNADANDYYTLMFLNGNFAYVIEHGMNCSHALGWSQTFMKQGIALFLLYFFDGDRLPVGCDAMCSVAEKATGFTLDKYSTGMDDRIENTYSFWDCFVSWKERTIIVEELKATYVLNRIEHMIDMRIEGIMKNNRRNYYGECAAFLAALGEVYESLGRPHGKQGILAFYKKKYFRRSSFIKELRNYGYDG